MRSFHGICLIFKHIQSTKVRSQCKSENSTQFHQSKTLFKTLHPEMKKLFGKKSKTNDENKSQITDEECKLPPLNIMVMDGDRSHNWPSIFDGKKTRNNRPIHIYQASWNKVEVTTYPEGPMVHMQPLHTTESYKALLEQQDSNKGVAYQNMQQSYHQPTVDIKPHFLLIRNQPRGALPVTDCLNAFYGLMMSNVPCMNSFQAVYMNLERPIMLGALREIENRVGHDKFPLINATYYSSERQMVIAPEMPAVIKIAHAHAGIVYVSVSVSTICG